MDFLPEGLRPFAVLVPIALAFMLLALLLRFARRSGSSHLANLYPAVEPAPGTRLHRDRAVFGRSYLSMAWVRIGADQQRLHVRMVRSFQGGSAFSVPLDEVTATPDRYGWMILAPATVRLCFARAPEVVMMIFPADFAKLVEASRGRLRLAAVHGSSARAAPAAGTI